MMKHFLLKIALFVAVVCVFDLFYGKICDYLRDHTKGGFSGNIQYICKKSNEDIILMGSSRMRHHYVPQIFEDSLGMSCYNAGIDGNGILLSYGFLEMILQRYTPKMIIYDVSGYDMYSDDNVKYLSTLRPYYKNRGIDQIFKDVDNSERLKMNSNLYRYNSKLLSLIAENIHPTQSFEKGYWPSNKQMKYEPVMPKEFAVKEIDLLKIDYFHKFINQARSHGIDVVISVSPTWFGAIREHYNDPLKEVCSEENVVFLNHYYDKMLCASTEYWADASHLNDRGARLFSAEIAKELKEILEKKQ